MKRNVDKITEEIFIMSSNRRLAVHLLGVVNEDDFEEATILHAVYTNDARDLICHHKFKGVESDVKRSFKDELSYFLKEYKPESKGIKDYLFFLGAFNPVNESPTIQNISRYEFREHSVLSDILEDTRGILIFHKQLEELCSLFCQYESCVRSLREALNCKVKRYENIAKEYKFNENLSLYDVASSRMLLGKTVKPNYKGAYILFKTLMDKNSGGKHGN